jgi:hypothetical protein
VERARQLGYAAIAVTDEASLAGIVRAHVAARVVGIKLMCGAQLAVECNVLAGGVYDTWNGNFDGAGNDTYPFGRGDGQDLLYDNDTTFDNVDQIVFASGIATSQVQFTRA